MTRRQGTESIKVLINHWRWLEANGYKQPSRKLQASSSKLDKKTLQ
jgi:hypothetical protein